MKEHFKKNRSALFEYIFHFPIVSFTAMKTIGGGDHSIMGNQKTDHYTTCHNKTCHSKRRHHDHNPHAYAVFVPLIQSLPGDIIEVSVLRVEYHLLPDSSSYQNNEIN